MSDGTIIPMHAPKACSGKCKSGTCHTKANVWVLAACEGMAVLFEKQADGHLRLLPQEGSAVASFTDALRDHLAGAAERSAFSQLVLVGGANDISWTQASLPPSISGKVVAEIEYPLIPGWFTPPGGMEKLTQALEHVFRG